MLIDDISIATISISILIDLCLIIPLRYREWITYQIPSPVPIEKSFSKTHAPVFGLMLDRNF